MRTLSSHANLSLSEQGVHCLYVVFGFLKWFESVDSETEHLSPLMLVPMSLSRASADAAWELVEAEDDAVDNLSLRERLKQDFGMELPSLPDIDMLEVEGARLAFLESVRKAIAANERWEVVDRCALGRFAFPKVAMWQDLGDHEDAVLAHTLCRSMGGDESISPQVSFGLKSPLPEAATLDDAIAPGEVKAILDCDSSQLEAIIAARRGVSFVLDGPPGTGKSQTIANIIADALSQGRRVLFVSEKVSALEVVKRRLDECGLGAFCLECHSNKANRKAVLDELRYCLELPIEVYDDTAPRLDEAKRRREALNLYVRSIHRRRPPLGLSPFELYGHVSRSHRLGHAVKSRCVLPSVEQLDRSRLEDCLRLVERANESGNVIRHHQRHPWRGCQLTARTLTLSDNLQHHLGSLGTAFGGITQVFTPLVEQGILSEEPTATTLKGVIREFGEALKAPQIPADWLQAPREVAATVLRRHEAMRLVGEQRARLCEFVEDVESLFPAETTRLSQFARPADWETKFVDPVPQTVRRQHELLDSQVRNLRSLLEFAGKSAEKLAAVIGALPIRLRPDVPPYKYRVVIELAKLIASVHPLRPDCLDPDNWPKLRAGSQVALAKLEKSAAIEKRLEGRLEADQILRLHQTAVRRPLLATRFATVQSVLPESQFDELADFQKELGEAVAVLREIESLVASVLREWGIDGEVGATLSQVRSLLTAIPLWRDIGELSGRWRDPAVRSKVRAGCVAAIMDLTETAEIRSALEERLSHRAFKATAIELINRASAYQSFWKRLFGGFGVYRQEVAELFKAGCPATPTLLSDLHKLRTWHRRIDDVRETATGLAAFLPEEFAADELESWKQVEGSVQAFDRFASAVPDIAGRLPVTGGPGNPSTLGVLWAGLSHAVERLETLRSRSLKDLISDVEPCCALIGRLQELSEATGESLEAAEELGPLYAVRPRALKTLAADCELAKSFSGLQGEVIAQHRLIIDLLPHDAPALDRSGWQRVERSVQAVEQIGRFVPSLREYQDRLCKAEHLDAAGLSAMVAELEAAYRSYHGALEAVAPQFQLLSEPLTAEDLIRRPLNDVVTGVREVVTSMDERSQLLTAVVPCLLPDTDVAVESLPGVAVCVERLRASERAKQDCQAVLREWEVNPEFDLADGGFGEATWLLGQVNAGSLTPLVRAVATSPEVRKDVREGLERCQRTLSGELGKSFVFLLDVFPLQEETGEGISIGQMPLKMLGNFLSGRCRSLSSLDEWLKFSRWRRDMSEQGFGGVVDELLSGCYEPAEAKSVIAARLFHLVFDQFAHEDRLIGEFDLDTHEQTRERFRKLDAWEVRVAGTQIRQFQLNRDDRPRSAWCGEGSSELGILQREIQKKRRQLPLRKLFAEIPGVLQRLKPCIMMSPLSVSTFLQSNEIRFDLVIFDEASQVFPWDAVGAIYRGSQLIVAGDEKQLPPTNFFNRADLESNEEDESDIGDFESILSLCKSIGMPARGLRWHYRSRREPLIAFSNRHFYSGDLVTFPSVRDATSDAVRLEFVPQGRWIDRVNLAEAERVTDLVIHHLRTRAETSLGIIAFNQSQQSAIEDAIHERRRRYPEVEALFHIGLSEPLFVKNLENVQGDERDVIILSMGYGYNEAGKFLKNFGPLTKSGGERRLNVAVTRAREEVVLVASVKAADLDLSGSTSLGANLLKGYLAYAERGVDAMAREVESITGEAESNFEEEVAAGLISRGLHPVLQVGCGGFRIDMALKHPERPGEFCLGIECDGATYHSSKTARDRDRIRQNVLENLGWNIIRLWSTDWIRDPERQINRVLAAYARATALQPSATRNEEPAMDADLTDLTPRIEVPQEAVGPVYKAIRDVPEKQLRETFQTIVKRGGAIDREGLIQQTSRALGFTRTGKAIRTRLESTLNELMQVGHWRWIGDRIAVGSEDSA
jgi:very-short-patch-repair endonuclease